MACLRLADRLLQKTTGEPLPEEMWSVTVRQLLFGRAPDEGSKGGERRWPGWGELNAA